MSRMVTSSSLLSDASVSSAEVVSSADGPSFPVGGSGGSGSSSVSLSCRAPPAEDWRMAARGRSVGVTATRCRRVGRVGEALAILSGQPSTGLTWLTSSLSSESVESPRSESICSSGPLVSASAERVVRRWGRAVPVPRTPVRVREVVLECDARVRRENTCKRRARGSKLCFVHNVDKSMLYWLCLSSASPLWVS